MDWTREGDDIKKEGERKKNLPSQVRQFSRIAIKTFSSSSAAAAAAATLSTLILLVYICATVASPSQANAMHKKYDKEK